MATQVTRFQTKSATGRLEKFDLSCQHITTNDFGIIKPLAMKYVVPGDKHTIKFKEFDRLMPMPAPTFGSIRTKTRAYFVPMRTVYPKFLNAISDNLTPSGTSLINQTQSFPYTTEYDLLVLFLNDDYSTVYTGTGKYDFCVTQSSSALVKYKFTLKGKRIRDMLLALGMNFPLFYRSSSAIDSNKISVLPLLALLRIYYDWCVPARYINSSNYHRVIGLINQFHNTNSASWFHVTATRLHDILFELRAFLEEDFFTSAWENPQSMTNGTADSSISLHTQYNEDTRLNEVTVYKGQNTETSAGAIVYGNSSGGTYSFDMYTLHTLGALTDMLNRGMLAGTKVRDWLKTEFGITLDRKLSDTSVYLGKHEGSFVIGDVMSMADTKQNPLIIGGGSYLGQFAGKALGANDGTFSFESEEHGYIIITNEIVPRTSYYQGLRPEFKMLKRFDFFQPEFDNLGTEPIPLSTLVNDFKVGNNIVAGQTINDPNEVFGFTPRYSSLKTSFDAVSGDFRVESLNTGLDSWYLTRDFSLIQGEDTEFKEVSLPFNDASEGTSTNSYDRIFTVANTMADHIFQYFHFDWEAWRPMKSISSFLMPEHEDNGKNITVSPNGNPS